MNSHNFSLYLFIFIDIVPSSLQHIFWSFMSNMQYSDVSMVNRLTPMCKLLAKRDLKLQKKVVFHNIVLLKNRLIIPGGSMS